MLPTLSEFLGNIRLDQYYGRFVQTGATDQDLSQLVVFDDADLNDILNAVQMLPFHAIKFKKALRELRTPPSSTFAPEHHHRHHPVLPSLHHILSTVQDPLSSSFSDINNSTRVPSREVIISHATIYGKRSTRSLTSYETAINEAAIQLALQDPSLIVNKGDLFERAKRKLLDSGYQYKRGKSRSKLIKQLPYQQASPQTKKKNTEWPKIKRWLDAQQKSNERLTKINALQHQLEGLASASNPEAVSTRKAIAKEISRLKSKERKHQWYERRKSERSDSGFSEGGSSEENEEDVMINSSSVTYSTRSSSPSSLDQQGTLALLSGVSTMRPEILSI